MPAVHAAPAWGARLRALVIAAGSRLVPYEVISALGAGGMGEVYRAKDTRVDRLVALKVLPEELFEDEDGRARFEREARTLASLNHPGIAILYSFEEVSGRHLLAMELVEGEGLDQKIATGFLPLDESLSFAKQIAEALEAAHERGIVHRDLKPANVKVTEDGRVKLLDFGLAKAFEGEKVSSKGGSAGGLTQSPTLTARATAAGMILGTAAYMSPEQARGKSLDKRADVWAFGCVLFEMLTGKRAFEGETVSDTLAAILRGEADFALLPPATPPRHRRRAPRPRRDCRRKRIRPITLRRKDRIAQPHCRSERFGGVRAREQEGSLFLVVDCGRVCGRCGCVRSPCAARSRPRSPAPPRPGADRLGQGLVSRGLPGREARRLRLRPRRPAAYLAQADAGRRRTAADVGSGRPAAFLAGRKLSSVRQARRRRLLALQGGRPRGGAAAARRQRRRRNLFVRRTAARVGPRSEGGRAPGLDAHGGFGRRRGRP